MGARSLGVEVIRKEDGASRRKELSCLVDVALKLSLRDVGCRVAVFILDAEAKVELRFHPIAIPQRWRL